MPKPKAKKKRDRTGYVFVELDDRSKAMLESVKAFHEHITGEKTSKAAVLRMSLRETYSGMPESFQNLEERP